MSAAEHTHRQEAPGEARRVQICTSCAQTLTHMQRQPEHPTSGALIHHWALTWQQRMPCNATLRKEVKLPNKTLSCCTFITQPKMDENKHSESV